MHTANGPQLSISYPPFPPSQGRNAGAYLRERYGGGYVSIGVTFHHGAVNVGWNPPEPYPVPAPPSEFAEWTLGDAGLEDFIVDLHAPAPDEVRAWLSVPARLRVIGPSYEPERDSDYFMSINSLAESFDAIIQLEEVTPTRLLLPRR